jgi:hypothetical protein
VAKVICDRPTRRAASITLITAWCGAVASALITSTLSRPTAAACAFAACASAAATASTLLPSTAVLFTA